MTKFLATLAATMIATLLISCAWVAGAVSIAPAHAGGGNTPDPVLKGVIARAATHPCPTEDSINCYWDARLQGNGHGHSFYSVRVGGLTKGGEQIARDCIIYWNPTYNRTYGQCYRVR